VRIAAGPQLVIDGCVVAPVLEQRGPLGGLDLQLQSTTRPSVKRSRSRRRPRSGRARGLRREARRGHVVARVGLDAIVRVGLDVVVRVGLEVEVSSASPASPSLRVSASVSAASKVASAELERATTTRAAHRRCQTHDPVRPRWRAAGQAQRHSGGPAVNLNYLDHFGFSTKPFTKELGDAELCRQDVCLARCGRAFPRRGV